MATIPKQQAVDRLAEAVKKAPTDDLVEYHNELFPEKPTSDEAASKNPSALVNKIAAHIDKGLEVEEILDLWNVVFPRQHSVWFDEEEGLMYYDEKIEPVVQAD